MAPGTVCAIGALGMMGLAREPGAKSGQIGAGFGLLAEHRLGVKKLKYR